MADDDNGDGNGVLGKILLSVVVIIAAIPGLVIEPGPLSEIAALAILAGIWGSSGDKEAVKEAT